ncbi:MAG: prephenate dehydratase [Actinobacteria bacterium]|nr:MAG: prephenate dehydratase [Actinomycetota bacterium]
MKVAFLGPEGTFTEEAALAFLKALGKSDEAELVGYSTVTDAIEATTKGEADKAVVPIENSVEGSVNATLDALAFESDLVIEREMVMPIRHALIVSPKADLSKIRAIVSHPQATAQCRRYLAEHFPNVPIEAANSTAEAVARAAEDPTLAAVGTKLAAELYGAIFAEVNIEDYQDNKTRFVLLGREPAAPTGKDKTSLVCFIHKDQPGSLLSILQEFAFRYINLTKIQSRPTKKVLGEYYFFIDLEGHKDDDNVVAALKCLACKLRAVRVLGSYPMS